MHACVSVTLPIFSSSLFPSFSLYLVFLPSFPSQRPKQLRPGDRCAGLYYIYILYYIIIIVITITVISESLF